MTRTILILCVLALSVFAQAGKPDGNMDVGPALIPATATAAISGTAYIHEITLTNESAADVTCTIKSTSDGRALFGPSAVVLASTSYVMTYQKRRMPGGVTWSCSSATAITGYITYSLR